MHAHSCYANSLFRFPHFPGHLRHRSRDHPPGHACPAPSRSRPPSPLCCRCLFPSVSSRAGARAYLLPLPVLAPPIPAPALDSTCCACCHGFVVAPHRQARVTSLLRCRFYAWQHSALETADHIAATQTLGALGHSDVGCRFYTCADDTGLENKRTRGAAHRAHFAGDAQSVPAAR